MVQGTSSVRRSVARMVIGALVIAGMPFAGAVVAPSAGAATTPVDVVVNGSFESGFTGWTVQDHPCPYMRWTSMSGGYEGARHVANGFDGCPGRYAISQVVTLPGGTSELGWADRYQWNNWGTLPRTSTVEILDVETGALLQTVSTFSAAAHTSGSLAWTHHVAEIAGLGGRTVRLQFRQDIPQNFTGPAQYGLDAVSLIGTAPPDADGDGVADADDVCDGFDDAIDADGDGTPDGCDADIDGDGVANDDDAFPADASETADLDGDGTGDNADLDDDDDGTPDVDDSFPTDPTRDGDEDDNGIKDTPAPTTKDQCKGGGWARLDNPSFRNQGQCVSFVEAARAGR